MKLWQIWMIAAIFLFIIEIFSPAFIAFCVGVGALLGVLAAALGLNLSVQFIFFAVGALLAFVYARPVMLRYFHREEVKTNVDALSGRIGRVSEPIGGAITPGRVVIDGDDWRAVSSDDTPIEKDAKVEIVKVDSVTLIVKKIE